MKIAAAVDRVELEAGRSPFFIFDPQSGMTIADGLVEVTFHGPAVLRSGESINGARVWVEADLDSTGYRRHETLDSDPNNL